MIKKQCKILIIILFTGAALFLYTNLCILYGALKERKAKICIGAYELATYEKTLETASLICIGVQQFKSSELSQCQAETKRWHDNYFWLKSQQVAATSTGQN